MESHEEMHLESFSKQFEYEKISREIDACDDIDVLRHMLKSYVKLHFRTQETLLSDFFKRG